MKKLTAVLLALVLAATLCIGAIAEDSAVDYTGTWTATTLEVNGAAMDPAMLGMSMTMVLNEDGSCVLTALGMEQIGTWAVTDTGITTTDADGVVDTYTLIDGKLVAEAEGMKITFTAGAPEAAAAEEEAELATVLAGLALADFNGHWKLTSVEAANMAFPPEALGLSLDIVLQDGAGIYTFASAQGSGTVSLACEIEEIEEVGTVLWTYALNEAGEAVSYGPTLMLYSDGVLVWDASTEEMDMVYCLELQVEETAAE